MGLINRLKYYYGRIPNIPKTLLFNFYYLPFKKAIHFPIYVGKGVKIVALGDRNSVQVDVCKRGIICIGTSKGSHSIANKRGCWEIEKNSKIIFCGSCSVAAGGKISVKSGAKLIFGNGCTFNANTLIVAKRKISFGNDFMASWNTSYLDDDGHKIAELGSEVPINEPKEINIGNHVWIGEATQVLKGAVIGNDTVVAAGSMVLRSKTVFDTNVILAGVPAKVIKTNIIWSRDAYE